jgi:hypothetical protein
MRFAAVTAAVAVVLLTTACSDAPPPTAATERPQLIINGQPTGSSFGNVGALLYDFDGDGVDGFDQVCTGSLISPTVFQTAAHCVYGAPATAQFYVSFDPDLLPAPKPVIAARSFHIDPAYGRDPSDPHDLAVLILPERATRGITPLQLPPEGYLDALAANGGLTGQLFLNVGYGTAITETGIPHLSYDGQRKVSKSEFMALRPVWLGLQMNSKDAEEGGDCYGDSGGPKFLDGNPNMVVAAVVTGDRFCRATSWDYRLDTPSARGFLGRFVELP